MKNKDIRIEAMDEILSDLGIKLTSEQIEKIVTGFSYHIDMEGEMESYQHVGFKEECSKCKSLESKLKESNSELEIYRNSVKQRRNGRLATMAGKQ